ncbi:hypothetical protein LCGC14_1360090 [marine sediment metagenome]|uniref:Uncharacterized protein n=1 Tax=marine sediment metagenome TaxID=412755 RepID=A0A0F9KUF2_9ZZZZ
MGKEKKSIGIKTSRYFTKSCSHCGFEYPNWFTNCPKCGVAWDDAEIKKYTSKESQKKTIKIVVKITEEDFEKTILKVNLIFSADQGKSWYQMEMDAKIDYFLAEIAEIPMGSVIIYYIEVYLEDGERIIENNENNYFYYKVGVPIGEPEGKPTEIESQALKENIKKIPILPQEYYQTPKESLKRKTYITREMIEQSTKTPVENVKTPSTRLSQDQNPEKITILGKPQTRIDPDLKICTHCKSKIKKMWSTCPICGKSL